MGVQDQKGWDFLIKTSCERIQPNCRCRLLVQLRTSIEQDHITNPPCYVGHEEVLQRSCGRANSFPIQAIGQRSLLENSKRILRVHEGQKSKNRRRLSEIA